MAPPRGLSTPRALQVNNNNRKVFGRGIGVILTELHHILHARSCIHFLWLYIYIYIVYIVYIVYRIYIYIYTYIYEYTEETTNNIYIYMCINTKNTHSEINIYKEIQLFYSGLIVLLYI